MNGGLYARAGAPIVTAEIIWTEKKGCFTIGLVMRRKDNWEIVLGVLIGINDGAGDVRFIFTATRDTALGGAVNE